IGILVPCCTVVSYGVKLHLVGLGQSLVVTDVVFLVNGLSSIVFVRLGFQDLFVDFILSIFISLLSYLVAHFIANHVSGGSSFRRICYSRLFMVSSLSFGFSVVVFHSPQSGCLYSSRAFLGVGVRKFCGSSLAWAHCMCLFSASYLLAGGCASVR
ncbi:LOW QUALITY PROTEIN: hypothetical protein HID58_052185, partial [Brassica napus]